MDITAEDFCGICDGTVRFCVIGIGIGLLSMHLVKMKFMKETLRSCSQGKQGMIDLPIGKNPDPMASPRMRIDEEGGRPCSTRWEVVERLGGPVPRTRVKLEPLTGRSHQLRLHMKAIG